VTEGYHIAANVEFRMAPDRKPAVTHKDQQDLPKAADRKNDSAKQDASVRAKAIMARFRKTMARLAK
jgi:hypothetical protein